jgi:hypothetical protein
MHVGGQFEFARRDDAPPDYLKRELGILVSRLHRHLPGAAPVTG